MNNNKKDGNWLTELLEEFKLSLTISYLEFFVTYADAKEYVQKNKDSLTPAALNKREMKKVKAAPWLLTSLVRCSSCWLLGLSSQALYYI